MRVESVKSSELEGAEIDEGMELAEGVVKLLELVPEGELEVEELEDSGEELELSVDGVPVRLGKES